MALLSSTLTWNVLLVVVLIIPSFGQEGALDSDILPSLSLISDNILDLLSLETEAHATVVQPSANTRHTLIGEESKDSIRLNKRKQPNGSPRYTVSHGNVTDDSYNVIQWFTRPTRPANIKHHVEASTIDLQRKIINDKQDLNAQSSSAYAEEYSHDRHGDHSLHHDDDSHHDHDRSYVHNDDEANIEPPSSNQFQKPKTRKVRKNCRRVKDKKAEGWPDRSDTIIHSKSHNHHAISHRGISPMSSEAFPGGRFSDIPRFPMFPVSERIPGFSGEHLHGIPRTHAFSFKTGDPGNHFHLHNHHYHYLDGKKTDPLAHLQSYRNIIESFEKLKTMVSEKDSNIPVNPHFNQGSSFNGESPDTTESAHPNTEKRGYHYTGPHESYGRKTYYRTGTGTDKTNSPISSVDGNSFGTEMFKYGAGQYGTDEFHDGAGHYPNEVTMGGDKTYPHSGESQERDYGKRIHGTSGYDGYNQESVPPRAPYEPQTGPHNTNFDGQVKDDKYSPDYERKSPYSSVEEGERERGYEENQEGPVGSGHAYPYPKNFAHEESQTGTGVAHNVGQERPTNLNGQNPDHISHSVSYSHNNEVGHAHQGASRPENGDVYQNLRPDPDPLSIPRNARIIEHHIRLHPIHYKVFPQLPMPVVERNNPFPAHKLIPNPLQVPQKFFPPPKPVYPNHNLNEMLQAYQSRSLLYRWW